MGQMDLNDIKAAYPQWHVRRTLSGSRIATRMDKDDLTDQERYAGLVMTLIYDTWDAMVIGLGDQADKERKLADQLIESAASAASP